MERDGPASEAEEGQLQVPACRRPVGDGGIEAAGFRPRLDRRATRRLPARALDPKALGEGSVDLFAVDDVDREITALLEPPAAASDVRPQMRVQRRLVLAEGAGYLDVRRCLPEADEDAVRSAGGGVTRCPQPGAG